MCSIKFCIDFWHSLKRPVNCDEMAMKQRSVDDRALFFGGLPNQERFITRINSLVVLIKNIGLKSRYDVLKDEKSVL